MEALLLLCEIVVFTLVLLWIAKGRGDSGLFAWKQDAVPPGDPAPLRRAGPPRAAGAVRRR